MRTSAVLLRDGRWQLISEVASDASRTAETASGRMGAPHPQVIPEEKLLLTELLVPTYRNMLRMLLDLLIKAEATRPGGADGLLSERLVPDMLPLSSQICFAACQAQEAAYRLRGAPIPTEVAALVAEGRAGGSAASSQELARSLLRQALDRLDEIPDDATGSLASRSLTIEVGEGIAFDLTGEQYVRDWALPQFYFHVVTAYALLRSRGLEIGKADYVPHMFQYLRR